MLSIMLIKIKILVFMAAMLLVGCSGNSSTTEFTISNTIKRFTGVVNNSSVVRVEVAAIPIGSHGQFRLDAEGEVETVLRVSDENGRFGINLKVDEIGPYILTATSPEYTSETEDEKAAKASCQLVSGCMIGGESIPFGSFYSLEPNLQWSAAVESISEGQFIVVNPITEMARVLGFSEYINESTASEVSAGEKPAANYYSNYGVVKGNSQTAALLGLGNILSSEPVDLTDLHLIEIEASSSLQESIRYGALLAAWQQLELEYNNSIVEGDFPFQADVIAQFIGNKGQLYQALPQDGQILSLKQWYMAALANLEAVRDYHSNLSRSLPGELNLVITRFQGEIDDLSDGSLTQAEPVIGDQFVADYSDAVSKTKAMIEYMSNLKNNFATEDFREGIKDSSDLVTMETRRLSPKFDGMMKQLLSIYQYYLSCTQSVCDDQSIWHSENNVFVMAEKKLSIVQAEDTRLELSQGFVYDEANPEDSEKVNTHDLFLSGAFEYDDLRVELSDFTSENAADIKSSIRFSYSGPLAELPSRPEFIEGGKGATVDESLIPDYIELVFPDFKLYDTTQLGAEKEVQVTGSFSAVMVANTDASDFIDGKDPKEKLGKRYNLSSVRATLKLLGGSQGSTEDSVELKDNAVIYLEAVASEAFVSNTDFIAYFPDEVYPTFEAFFKPREGFSVGSISPAPLVVSRRGVMNFPELTSEGEVLEGAGTVEVQYIELDYEIGGLERYVVYPKIEGDDEYWGLICSAQPDVEDDLVDPEYTKTEQNEEGEDVVQVLLICPLRDKYEGDATPDDLVNKVYALNKDFFNLREYNGQGTYRINYPTSEAGLLNPFPADDTPYWGEVEKSIVLGVDSMRFQFKPEIVNQAGNAYLPESVLDVSLVWRTHELIDVNVLMAFDTEQIFNNPNGSGLPYLAVGSESESYSVAYRTYEDGTESGEYAMSWAGVNFIDGPVDGSKVMQKTDDVNLQEGVFAVMGSNVTYSPYSKRELQQLNSEDGVGITEEKCGFFGRGLNPTEGEDCDAIAYLTFRGLVTGSLREERDGVYVIRYIDGSWQVLGN